MSHPEHDPQSPTSAGGAAGAGPAAPGFRGYEQQPGGYGQQPAPGYGTPPTHGYDPQQLSYGYGEQTAGPGQQPYPDGQAYGPPAYGVAPGSPASLDLPAYGIGPVEAVKRGFAKYARFDGRASRAEYWWWGLVLTVLITVLAAAAGLIGAFTLDGSGEPSALMSVPMSLFSLTYLAAIVPTIAVSVRRLHDAGYSGWLCLLALTGIGGFVLIVLYALPPNPSGARFDRRPALGSYPG